MKVQQLNPATIAQRRPRAVAAVGAAVAAGTLGLMALAAGTAAAADEPGRCNETVNVRAEPDLTAPVVGVCPAGTEVQIGEIREGYLYLTDYAGWAAWEYLSIGGEPTDPSAAGPSADPSSEAPAGADPAGADPMDAAPVEQDTPSIPDETSAATTAGRPSGSPVEDTGADTAGDSPGAVGTPSMTPTPDPTPGDS